MAKQNLPPPTSSSDDGIPVVTIPGSLKRKFGNIFLIIGILAGEFLLAYTIVSIYYPQLHQMAYGTPPDFGGYYEIGDLVVNPAGTEGQRYLLVSIGLEVRSKKDMEAIQQREVVIRDALLNMLARRTIGDLASIDNRNDLKQEMGIMVNQILGRRAVRNLFFTQYVMQ